MNITKDDILQLIESGDWAEAEEQSKLLVQKCPDDADAKVTLGRILGMQGKDNEAIAVLEEALQQDSQNFEALFFLAQIHEDLGEYGKALQFYRKALQSGQYESLVCYRMGRIHADHQYEQRSAEQARSYFLRAIEGEKPIEEAFIELAKMEQPKRAVYVLQKGLSLFPQSFDLYHELAWLYLYKLEDSAGCIDAITLASDNRVDTDELRFFSAVVYYKLGEYRKSKEALASISAEEEGLCHALKCLKSALLMEEGEYDTATAILQGLITEDFRNRLDFAAHFLLMCCYLRQGNVPEAESIFAEIPESPVFGGVLMVTAPPFGGYYLDQYLVEALDGLISNGSGELSIAKARGIRALSRYYQSHTNRLRGQAEDTDWQTLKEDLSAAVKAFPHNVEYNSHLGHVLSELHDWVGAARYYILAQVSTDEEQYLDLDSLDKIYRSKTKFSRLLKEIDKILATDPYRWKDRFARFLLEQLIEFLHSKKDHERVIQIGEKFEYRQLLQADVLFEMAYAYVKTGHKKKGMSFYRAYLRDIGEESAVCNNLGVLCEDDGDLEEAERLFRRALDLAPGNESAQTNLERVRGKIGQAEEQKRVLERAVHLYSQENVTVRRAIAKLYEERIEDDIILCNLDRLASSLKVHPSEGDAWVDGFLEKKYFEEVANHGLAFDGIALRANPVLVPQLKKELGAAREEEFVEQLAVELSPANLDQKYEYNQSLIKRLSLLSSAELTAMLERDLREAVIALATQCYKSALVLCGSIIEAILMDRLMARRDSAIKSLERLLTKEGKRIRAQDKRIENWTLERLLDVAREENIISGNLYYWGHGIRGFRNLVHPGVEQRRTVDVSRDNAEIAWMIVKRLLKELT
jgi:tetratricopeptide (TPR) repeat protein